MEYKVIRRFKERYQKFKLYEIGDTYSYQNEERIAFLVKEGFLEGKPKPKRKAKKDAE